MASMFAVFVTVLVSAQAGLLPNPAYSPLVSFGPYPQLETPEIPSSHPWPTQYNFKYSVDDPIQGNFQSHDQIRNGDKVEGSYSLVEADGQKRIVTYTSDKLAGFNAVVRREPSSIRIPAPPARPFGLPLIVPAPPAPFGLPLAIPHAPIKPFGVPFVIPHAPVETYGLPSSFPSSPLPTRGIGASYTSFSSPHAHYFY